MICCLQRKREVLKAERLLQIKLYGHQHAAFKSRKLVGITGDVVTVDAEIFNPDGFTFKTIITHKLTHLKE